MSAANTGTRLRWVWAVIGALAAVVSMMLLFSLARAPAPSAAPVRTKPAIELADRAAKSALDDEATLLDPTPLFMPTKWNAAQKDVAPPEPGGTFQSYRFPAKPEFAETDLKLGPAGAAGAPGQPPVASRLWSSIDLPDPVAVPQKPADTLAADAPGALALGFGRTDTPVAALPVRGASVEIVSAGSGERALPEQAMAQVQALAAAARPPAGRPWTTMEFVAAIDATGLAAPLAVEKPSGVEEVDVYFQNFLKSKLRVGERLAPGFYRISIGP
jgi:hypothetical protein